MPFPFKTLKKITHFPHVSTDKGWGGCIHQMVPTAEENSTRLPANTCPPPTPTDGRVSASVTILLLSTEVGQRDGPPPLWCRCRPPLCPNPPPLYPTARAPSGPCLSLPGGGGRQRLPRWVPSRLARPPARLPHRSPARRPARRPARPPCPPCSSRLPAAAAAAGAAAAAAAFGGSGPPRLPPRAVCRLRECRGGRHPRMVGRG